MNRVSMICCRRRLSSSLSGEIAVLGSIELVRRAMLMRSPRRPCADDGRTRSETSSRSADRSGRRVAARQVRASATRRPDRAARSCVRVKRERDALGIVSRPRNSATSACARAAPAPSRANGTRASATRIRLERLDSCARVGDTLAAARFQRRRRCAHALAPTLSAACAAPTSRSTT